MSQSQTEKNKALVLEAFEVGHVRLVYGVQSLPIGAPLIVDVIFEIEPKEIQQ